MISLQRRLKRALAWTLVLVFLAHWLAADWVIRFVAENEVETRLEHDGDSLLASLRLGENGELLVNDAHMGLIYAQPRSGHYYLIQRGGSTWLSPSSQNERWEVHSVVTGGRKRYHATGPNRQPVLVLTRGLSLFGRDLQLSVAEDLTQIGSEILMIRLSYLALTFLVLLTAIVLQGTDVRRALRPVRVIREELRQVTRGERTRISAEAPPEIKPLVDEINHLLELVERRLQQSRTAIGNLAHALKTPLSILFRLAGDAQPGTKAEWSEAIEEQVSTIHNRLERELKRARLAGDHKPGGGFVPADELNSLTRLLLTIHGKPGLRIEVFADHQRVPYDRQDMLELIGNLADNACKWAKSRVVIEVTWVWNHLTIKVADDGPGCAEDALPDLTRRGHRLDETQPGHGLGLAICADIAEFYGGNLTLARSPDLGGMLATVEL